MTDMYRVTMNLSIVDPQGADHTAMNVVWHEMTWADVVLIEKMLTDDLVALNNFAIAASPDAAAAVASMAPKS